jgi:hypothetical protein
MNLFRVGCLFPRLEISGDFNLGDKVAFDRFEDSRRLHAGPWVKVVDAAWDLDHKPFFLRLDAAVANGICNGSPAFKGLGFVLLSNRGANDQAHGQHAEKQTMQRGHK